MRLLESSAERYDRGISLLTFGNEQKIKREIASKFISKGDRVFEIGVGTGTLAVLCAKHGAHVMSIDISAKMLEIAKRKVEKAEVAEKVELKEMSIVEMDTYVPGLFFR